jgi:hypothetical protein
LNGLFLNAGSILDRKISRDKLIDAFWIEIFVQGSSPALLQGSVAILDWRILRKSSRLESAPFLNIAGHMIQILYTCLRAS